MKFIEQSVELVPQPATLEEAFKLSELAGRVSYMSYDSMGDNSYKKFIENMKSNEHLSVLEFTPVYLKISNSDVIHYDLLDAILIFRDNAYSKYFFTTFGIHYISTNYRVIVENELEDLLKYWTTPTEFHTKRVMFKVVTNIGVSRQFNRHRANSILEISTRYCNYSRDKFGKELTFTYPTEGFDKPLLNYYTDMPFEILEKSPSLNKEGVLIKGLRNAENSYMDLINKGVKPQFARHVLPLITSTTMYHSAFESDWVHFIKLRGANNAHPDIRQLASSINSIIFNN